LFNSCRWYELEYCYLKRLFGVAIMVFGMQPRQGQFERRCTRMMHLDAGLYARYYIYVLALDIDYTTCDSIPAGGTMVCAATNHQNQSRVAYHNRALAHRPRPSSSYDALGEDIDNAVP
jgi:hypothetical protein